MITFFHNNILIKHLPFVQIYKKNKKLNKKLKKKKTQNTVI